MFILSLFTFTLFHTGISKVNKDYPIATIEFIIILLSLPFAAQLGS